ncbi:MAG: multicopper oxidase domain-containing protein [Bacteroidia bacterium]
MKTFFSQYALFAVLALLCSCNSQNKNGSSADNENKTYGSPKATVAKETPSASTIEGPVAYAPAVPAAINSDKINVRIDVRHKKITVADGVTFWAWIFGDSIPGPVLHVKVGQTINFTMTNRSDETAQLSVAMPHSIDFHAAMVNPEDKYRILNVGETIHFQWTANYPGVFMYHCGTPAILQHMISGMIGMVIVDPKEGFPGKVDREYAVIQNEYYLKKESDSLYITDMEAAKLRQPTYVTFNGKYKQYIQHPFEAKAGERIRLYVLNTGPNLPSSFHIVGTIFDKVWLDGNPDNEMHGMQTVLLPSSGGAIVEFVVPESGTYAFVDHNFASVEQGAVGLIKAKE